MPRQPSFAGGELAPELYGRNDFAKYLVGLRRMRNFFAAKQGAAVSRAGTSYVAEVKDSSKTVRLIPFEYSDADSFVLEFGNQYIRVFKAGVYLGEISAGSGFANFAIPYLTAELPKLKFAQMGAVMTLCHPAHPPAELKWDGAAWTYAAISFDRSSPPCNPRVIRPLTMVTDASHPFREWSWKVTAVRRDPDKGFVYESAPYLITQASDIPNTNPATDGNTYAAGNYVLFDGHFYTSLQNANTGHPVTDAAWWAKDDTIATAPAFALPAQSVLYPDKPITIALAANYANLPTDPNFIAYRIYRGRDGLFGWIGDSKQATFTDVADAPDFAQPPPDGRNPFKVYNADGTLNRTEYPAAVCFFEGRRCFARSDQRPGFIWESASGDYYNFDTRLVPVADEAIEFELASRKREEIRSLVGLQKMIALTNASAWSVGGSSGPMTFDDLEAKAEAEVGASWVDPLVVDGAVLYPRTKGTGVRSLGFDFERQAFAPDDISRLAQHLFRAHQVVDWAFAQDPWGVVWVVRDDGLLLSLTYAKDEQVFAWAWHDTNGAVENVCSVPEGDEDALYLVVKRTINGASRRYIERMDSRVLVLDESGAVDPVEARALDCAKTYRGAPTNNIVGLNHLEAEQVYAVADGQVLGPFVVAGGAINLGLPPPADISAWVATAAVIHQRYQPGCAAYNGHVYAIAGDGAPYNTVEFAPINGDGTLGAWALTTAIAAFNSPFGPPPAHKPAALVAKGHLFVFGMSPGDGTTRCYSAAINGDGTLGAWTERASWPGDDTAVAVATDGNYVYALGGFNGGNLTTVRYAAVNADGSLGAWGTTTALPSTAYYGIANGTPVFVNGTKLYAVLDNGETVYATLNGDGTVGAWAVANAGLSGPYGLFWVSGDHFIHADTSGNVQLAPFNADGTLGAWTASAHVVASDGTGGAVAYGGNLYVVSGDDAGGNPQSTSYLSSFGGGAAVAHVGLVFTPELETLDMSGDRVKQKTVVSVGFELHESKGVSVGQDFDHLDTLTPQATFTDYTEKVDVQGTWGKSARAVLRQAQPLPVTVLGLTVEVDGGG